MSMQYWTGLIGIFVNCDKFKLLLFPKSWNNVFNVWSTAICMISAYLSACSAARYTIMKSRWPHQVKTRRRGLRRRQNLAYSAESVAQQSQGRLQRLRMCEPRINILPVLRRQCQPDSWQHSSVTAVNSSARIHCQALSRSDAVVILPGDDRGRAPPAVGHAIQVVAGRRAAVLTAQVMFWCLHAGRTILCHGVNIVDFISRSNFGFT